MYDTGKSLKRLTRRDQEIIKKRLLVKDKRCS